MSDNHDDGGGSGCAVFILWIALLFMTYVLTRTFEYEDARIACIERGHPCPPPPVKAKS